MRSGIGFAALLLTGCAATVPEEPVEELPFNPIYQPVETAFWTKIWCSSQ